MTSFLLLLCFVLLLSFCVTYGNLCNNLLFTCNNGQCIQKTWWCDDEDDCRDHSDEQYCDHKSGYGCRDDQFGCHSSTQDRKKCVPMAWTCDGISDCDDGSDEKLDRCIPKRNCTCEEFKCQNRLCIPLSQVCDGTDNCRDNSDENCWMRIPKMDGPSEMKGNLSDFLSSSYPSPTFHNEPHRFIITLGFDRSFVVNSSSLDANTALLIKKLDFFIAMALLKNQSEQLDATNLALYIHSQLAICSNPRNFFGTDLLALLEKKIVKVAPGSYSPLVSLALCNSGMKIPSQQMENLAYFLDSNSTETFITDMKALAVLAVKCAQKTNQSLAPHLDPKPTISYLKSLQKNDGSFRNLRTTAIIIQVLIATEDNGIGWNLTKALKYLEHRQLPDGSFGNLMTSYLVAPILSGQSFLNLYREDCISAWATDGERRKKLENMWKYKSFVTCSLWVRDNKHVVRSIGLRVPSEISIYDFMLLAETEDPCFGMECVRPEGSDIYSICQRPNSMETMEYWQFFKLQNGNLTLLKDDLSKIIIEDKGEYVFWFTKPQELRPR